MRRDEAMGVEKDVPGAPSTEGRQRRAKVARAKVEAKRAELAALDAEEKKIEDAEVDLKNYFGMKRCIEEKEAKLKARGSRAMQV